MNPESASPTPSLPRFETVPYRPDGGFSAAGTNFTTRIITTPDADIAEDRIVTSTGAYSATAPLSGSAKWVMQVAVFKAAGAPAPDTTAPSVSLTAPANGATVSGTAVTLSATASDNVGVVGVQFGADLEDPGVDVHGVHVLRALGQGDRDVRT